ncbi:MAG TPA: alanine--tRNA ligase [Ktedonobacterales bacterium]|nr:alanine--tRNA ligase [Ktedonobacterales bacterium]
MPAKRTQNTSANGKTAPLSGHSARKATPPNTSQDIRAQFLAYFEERDHQRVSSSSLIPPSDDPTVLLTTAGMQQMIPYFLGRMTPPSTRLTSVQKCFRTTDIDEVGDASHLTFFEMLGNFAVGAYFKREAIAFAWDLLTKVYQLPPDRLAPTVHPDDDEAPGYWQEIAGIPADGITRLEDNWWGPPGASGPCGPDSEIYYDRGAEFGCGEPDCAPGCDRCERYLEVWNLVFMQYYQDTDGTRTLLKQPNIDTGMGLERLTMVLQGKNSVFETDLFRPIIDKFATLAHTTYGENAEHDRALRVIADHGRALVFLAGDGVLPSNTGRGYIFRRVLRRAVRYGKMLGLEGLFLAEAADTVIDLMRGHYEELVMRRDQIVDVISTEERRFNQTLTAGLHLLTRELDALAKAGKREVPGELAFKLYDTHGFPVELTAEVARERGMTVDRAGYDGAMQRQQDQAQGGHVFVREHEEEAWTKVSNALPTTSFTGYEGTLSSSEVVAMLVNGKPADEASAPQEAALVLAATPFYAEAGGQMGDHGVIGSQTGIFQVSDTQRPVPGLIVHYGKMIEGHLRVGTEVRAEVDANRRRAIMRNHSATHLLHRALKDILGEQVHQQGSLVAPDRLRFDFNMTRPMTVEELREIDRHVNSAVLANSVVHTETMPYREAVATGAMALFSEKYGDTVRVVTMGTSKELCGGTHVAATGQIGLYLTTQEAGTAAGIRRVEALTGTGAETFVHRRNDLVSNLAGRLQTTPDALADRVRQLQDELADARRSLNNIQRSQAREEAARLAASPTEVNGVPLVAAVVSAPDTQALQEMSDAIRNRLGSGVILLAREGDGQAQFIVTIDDALTKRGLHAGKIAAVVGERLGGRGGGRPDSAQGGSKDVRNLRSTIAEARALIA